MCQIPYLLSLYWMPFRLSAPEIECLKEKDNFAEKNLSNTMFTSSRTMKDHFGVGMIENSVFQTSLLVVFAEAQASSRLGMQG